MKNMLNKLTMVGFVVCLGLCFYLSGVLGYAKDFCQTKITPAKNQITMITSSSTFACIQSALNKEQRERSVILTRHLLASKPGLKELPDGFSLSYTANEQNIKDVAEFVAYERLCCPFLNFEMSVAGENLTLTLNGAEGAKEFIKAEFNI